MSSSGKTMLVLLGGGEHARVVAEAAVLSGWTVRGCVSPRPEPGFEWLGDDDSFVPLPGDACLVAAVGQAGSSIRRRLIGRHSALRWATVVHPSAVVPPSAALGEGSFVAAGAILGTGARIGDHAIVNTGAQVDHDVSLGMGVHCAPAAVLGGGVKVGDWAFVGLGARIRDHLQIGAGALVAMGAVVVRNVAPGTQVMGNPARERKI